MPAPGVLFLHTMQSLTAAQHNRKRSIATALAACFLVMSSLAHAQPPPDSLREHVNVFRDYRLELLSKKQWEINKLSTFKNSSGKFKGFRIQVLNTNNRDQAYQIRGKLLRSFPEHNVYMAYQAPNYKLRIGDFVKKEDADKLKKQIETILGTTTYIVPDLITLSAEDQAKLLEEDNEE